MTSWKQFKLGDIVDYTNGGAWPASAYADEKGIPVVRVTDVQNFSIDLSACKYLKHEFKEKYNKHQLQPGDLIVCTVGSHPTQQSSVVGKTAAVNEKIAGAYLNQNAVLLRAKEEYLDKGWLSFFARTPDFKEHVESNARGSANQVRLAISSLLDMEVELPPLEEQRRVAEILFSLEDKIDLNRRMNQTLELMAQTLFRKYFVDGIDGENLPEGWEKAMLGDVVVTTTGCSYKSKELAPSRNALVTLKSFERKGGFRLDGFKEFTGKYKQTQTVSEGDIAIAHTDVTQNADLIGNPILIANPYNYENLVISMDLVKVEPKHESLSNVYLYFLMRDSEFKNHCLGHTNGTTVLHLSKSSVPNYKFNLPPKSLIQEFTVQAESILAKFNSNVRENLSLITLRDTLLPKLMSGEIDVMHNKPSALYEPVLS